MNVRSRSVRITLFLSAVCLLLAAGAARAADPDKVWVPEHLLPNGTTVPGYWRPAIQPGYVWVDARLDPEGHWVPGYWKPVEAPGRDKVWVPGYWKDGKWHEGHWISHRPGKRWMPGHYDPRGRWLPGHWR